MHFPKLVLFIFCLIFKLSFLLEFENIKLPFSHLKYYFNAFPSLKEKCMTAKKCVYKNYLESNQYDAKACWGYEPNCDISSRFTTPECPSDHTGYASSKEDQLKTFYHQTDFGFIKDQINEISYMCEPSKPDDSSLLCSSYLRFCKGTNIFFNFTDLAKIDEPIRYSIEVLKRGEIGGYCKFHREKLLNETDHMGALQSWAPELRYFTQLDRQPILNNMCDIIIEKPTFIMKIDASSNMYHHFCDFLNLYASLHINQTQPSGFSTDVQIIIWETYNYYSSFREAFNAFTDYPIWDLKELKGKTVCFKNLVMPLLPRMIFGLYYNTPIIGGCQKSGLFKAFSEHLLHRLNIPIKYIYDPVKIRITFLARRTKYRRILNEEQLLKELNKNHNYVVNVFAFENKMSFTDQLEIIRNTDILIGMHGAGLTHLLFLPDWSSIFELYHCEDPTCYLDLARLRGVNYLTWENDEKVFPQDSGHHPEGGAHAKFTNYRFDKKEFIRIVDKAANHVINNKHYQDFVKKTENEFVRDEL